MTSTAVPAAPQYRWLVAGGWGLVAALFARVALLAATAPHSVLLFLFPLPAWHLPAAAATGVLVWLAVFSRFRRPGRTAVGVAVAALLLALLAHRLIFNVELVNEWMPGFWVQ
jgi:hypothetical protein